MTKNRSKLFYLNTFFKKITYKKQYLQELSNKFYFSSRNNLKNNKEFNNKVYTREHNVCLILYIIEIFFYKTNTLIQVTNFFGELKFFCSAGCLNFKGKMKRARTSVIQSIIKILMKKLAFIKNKPLVLRFKNVGFKKTWVIKKLKRKIFIKTIVGLNLYSHNGCRKKKVRRKKFKSFKEIAEWLKAADCKSVKFFFVGSNPAFFIGFSIL